MADDTRQVGQREDLSREALNVHPENRAFAGGQWQDPRAQIPKLPENANMMPGGTMHTAGGQLPDVSLQSAFDSIKLEEFQEIHKKPCVRNALMFGIGAGAGLGGLRGVVGGRMWTSCNWAVGTFVVGSMGMYQYCQYRRHAEKEGMTRAIEILNKKEGEKKAREAHKEQMKAERRKAKEAEQDAQLAALRNAEAKREGGRSWRWW